MKGEIEENIKKIRPHILFSSFVSINPEVIEVGKELGLFVIIRQDYNLRDLTKKTIQKVIESYHKADFIITQTHEMKSDMLAIDEMRGCKIKVIDNPLDKEDILQKATEPNPFEDNGKFHFVWVGRKDPIKDLPTLKKAFEIVHEHYSDIDLTLITDNPNPYKWMRYADCLVISSLSEASPNVFREALFLGTRVISTDCCSTIREHLDPSLIAPIHDAEGLASVMTRVVLDDIKKNESK